MDPILNAVGNHFSEEWRVIVGAPIASLLLLLFALVAMWLLFRFQLANKRSSIEALDNRLRAREEEIGFLRRERDANLIDWFRREATKEINRIRSDAQHPFNRGDKIAVADMYRLYVISNIDQYGVEEGQKQ